MIQLTTLYDEYLDRSKLSEQKNPFEYIVTPRSTGVRTLNLHFTNGPKPKSSLLFISLMKSRNFEVMA